VCAACGSGGGFPDAREIDAPPPRGTFTLDWALSDTSSNNITCDEVGGQSVTVLAHNQAFEGAQTEVFVCSTLMGQSPGLEPGTYDFAFELDAASGVLATAPGQHNIQIASGQNTRLAPLAFSLQATGDLALHLSTGRAGGNCGLVSANGGGITATQITLTHNSNLACEPLTLTIGAGATSHLPGGTYTINCAAPTDGPCIETDQAITATGVHSDGYTIHIKGKQAAALCWTNNDSLMVPPLGATLTRTLNLGFASNTSGCM
jgi:hypothetical protein